MQYFFEWVFKHPSEIKGHMDTICNKLNMMSTPVFTLWYQKGAFVQCCEYNLTFSYQSQVQCLTMGLLC